MSFHNVPPNGFPDLPDVEELEAVEKDVATLKSTQATQGEAITALQTAVGTKAPRADIAGAFSEESAYVVGDLVYYDGTLYECTTAHEAGEWSAEDFTVASVSEVLNELNSNLSSKQNSLLQTGLFNTSTGVIETDIVIQKFISAYSANWDNAYCYVRRKSDNTAIIVVKDGSGNPVTNTNMAVVVNYLP